MFDSDIHLAFFVYCYNFFKIIKFVTFLLCWYNGIILIIRNITKKILGQGNHICPKSAHHYCGCRTRPAHSAACYNKRFCDFHNVGDITAIICPFNLPVMNKKVCQSLFYRPVCSGPTAWIVWIGPTLPSLWWGSARWPISFMHWAWLISLNSSLTQTVWGNKLHRLLSPSQMWLERSWTSLSFL